MHIFSAKNINVFAIFQDGNLANNFVKFWTAGLCSYSMAVQTVMYSETPNLPKSKVVVSIAVVKVLYSIQK